MKKKLQGIEQSSGKSPFFVRYLCPIHLVTKTGVKAGALGAYRPV